MKRKRVVKLPIPKDMSVADVLVVMNQTIVVTMVMQRSIDPNEAYDEWEANKENILACVQIIERILEAYGDELNVLKLTLPEGVRLGGYHVSDLDLDGRGDGSPF